MTHKKNQLFKIVKKIQQVKLYSYKTLTKTEDQFTAQNLYDINIPHYGTAKKKSLP